jgi:S-adenosylmethionine-diacylglycerol 3-amino-3-carboxypropyl transferase
MDLETLVRVFGPDATQNRRQEFALHFSERTRAALDVFLLRQNPFLCQVLVGERRPFRPVPWLELPRQPVVADLSESVGVMTDVLTATDVGGADLVHLSNILDWLHPDDASATLEAASRALRPGGAVIIRQLNSLLDVRSFDAFDAFDWDVERSRRYQSTDRSYFYRDIHVGRKR